ncbi:hypothetical protein HB662_08995 [Roseomonas frigidaquae]|uniref:H-NS histone family protein n=1 Tax=Falsiroseomonas frigidaquae TaxID=487318 RepID=A0ABX1EY09_9PROT|nr:hypothetical protein [Falsiroseomonas frigidaquae]NKE44914.1 hypothetical protein [Falsiroseomonas frigidaquae]
MVKLTLAELQARIEARKAELGMTDTPETIEALRNKGASRTAEKRELLRRIEQRAKAAGRTPRPAHF